MICTGNGTTGNGIYSNQSRRKRSTVVDRVAKVQVFVISPPPHTIYSPSLTETTHSLSLFLLSHEPFARTKETCVCVWPDAKAFLYFRNATNAVRFTFVWSTFLVYDIIFGPTNLGRWCSIRLLLITILLLIIIYTILLLLLQTVLLQFYCTIIQQCDFTTKYRMVILFFLHFYSFNNLSHPIVVVWLFGLFCFLYPILNTHKCVRTVIAKRSCKYIYTL